MKPDSPPVSAPRRDPNRCAVGKAIASTLTDPSILSKESLATAIYYLDSNIFTPSGLGKAARALRKEAKRRGVL